MKAFLSILIIFTHLRELHAKKIIKRSLPETERRLQLLRPIIEPILDPFRDSPSSSPSAQPTPSPTNSPTFRPTPRPTPLPTMNPTLPPTTMPTTSPTFRPTQAPSSRPTSSPVAVPTFLLTSSPTSPPSTGSSPVQTSAPTTAPTIPKTMEPTFPPVRAPARSPVSPPLDPVRAPTRFPTFRPTPFPTTSLPSQIPTRAPTSTPSSAPTRAPTTSPSFSPSSMPTKAPSSAPSLLPSVSSSALPSSDPSAAPSTSPSASPSQNPTTSFAPSFLPTVSLLPSATPSVVPSFAPSDSAQPTVSAAPSFLPSVSPSNAPVPIASAGVRLLLEGEGLTRTMDKLESDKFIESFEVFLDESIEGGSNFGALLIVQEVVSNQDSFRWIRHLQVVDGFDNGLVVQLVVSASMLQDIDLPSELEAAIERSNANIVLDLRQTSTFLASLRRISILEFVDGEEAQLAASDGVSIGALTGGMIGATALLSAAIFILVRRRKTGDTGSKGIVENSSTEEHSGANEHGGLREMLTKPQEVRSTEVRSTEVREDIQEDQARAQANDIYTAESISRMKIDSSYGRGISHPYTIAVSSPLNASSISDDDLGFSSFSVMSDEIDATTNTNERMIEMDDWSAMSINEDILDTL